MCREGGSGQRPPSEGPSQQLLLHETTCLVPSLPSQEPALGWRGEPKAFLGKLEGMDQCRAPNLRKGKEGEMLRKVVNSDMVLPSLHAFHTLNICSSPRDLCVGHLSVGHASHLSAGLSGNPQLLSLLLCLLLALFSLFSSSG